MEDSTPSVNTYTKLDQLQSDLVVLQKVLTDLSKWNAKKEARYLLLLLENDNPTHLAKRLSSVGLNISRQNIYNKLKDGGIDYAKS